MSKKSFDDVCQLEADIPKFFEVKPGSFYKDVIHSLPNKWRIVVNNNDDYIIDCVYSEDCNGLNYFMMQKNFLSNPISMGSVIMRFTMKHFKKSFQH